MRSIELTKKAFPALWEAGGGASNTGTAVCIADADGNPKTPIYINRSGHLSNGEHALIIVESGDLVVTVFHHREDFRVRIDRISSINTKEKTYSFKKINEFSRGEWDFPLPEALLSIVEATKNKATCYHCREPHFVK